MRFSRVVVVGCGGIFSYAREAIGRTMMYRSSAPKSILLIDGDHYEQSNLSRQSAGEADINAFKAEVAARRMSEDFPDISVEASAEFLKRSNVEAVIQEGDLVVSCVDNHEVRLLMMDRASQLQNTLVITAGNNLDEGNVHCFLVTDGVTRTLRLDEVHPEVREIGANDRNPGELSCEERAKLEGGRQTLEVNAMAAAWVVAFFSFSVSERKEEVVRRLRAVSEVNFCLKTYKALSHSRKYNAPVSF